jgi:hypothetical protein
MNIDTHADIDEQFLEDEGMLLCPELGHVLYLDVDPNIRGPTCVFSKYEGWHQAENNGNSREIITSMVSVPAVPGRVLRFPGSAMHAVPKPSTRWSLSPEEQAALIDQEESYDLEEDDDDDDDDDDEKIDIDDGDEDRAERSVILFNIWFDQGPRGVTQDYTKGALPEGIIVEDDGGNGGDYMAQEKARRFAEWEEDYGERCRDLWCRPRSEWQEVPITDTRGGTNAETETETTSVPVSNIFVSLMGKKSRRLYPRKYVPLSADAPDTLATALENEREPFHFTFPEKASSGPNENLI